MKLVVPLILLFAFAANTSEAANPRIGGAWVELRKAPLFESPIEKLADTWGKRVPRDDEFVIDKVYGRWLFGTPSPLSHMKQKDFAPTGWVYSRMLLLPGDTNTATKAELDESALLYNYSLAAWKKLGLSSAEETLSSLNFLENLVLSQKTMAAFRHFDEETTQLSLPSIHIEEAAEAANVKQDDYGLIGADLSFLKQEFEVVQKEKQHSEKLKQLKILHAPRFPAITQNVKQDILGRYMLYKYFQMPTLSHEEVDGYVYMRAIAQRGLQACGKKIQNYWKNRHWSINRVYQLKSRPEEKNPWLQLELPGAYFPVSARAIDVANNEAELAFLLLRPLVRATRVHQPKAKFGKTWPGDLETLSEEQWLQVLKSQSTKESKNLDIADEITVDAETVECLDKAGYASGASLSYLKRLSQSRENPWAKWYAENMIGIDYRVERLGEIPASEGGVINKKRFAQATKYWNVLP